MDDDEKKRIAEELGIDVADLDLNPTDKDMRLIEARKTLATDDREPTPGDS